MNRHFPLRAFVCSWLHSTRVVQLLPASAWQGHAYYFVIETYGLIQLIMPLEDADIYVRDADKTGVLSGDKQSVK